MNKLTLLAALLLSTAIGFGQAGLASVTGTVTDATGAVIANAPIEVHNLENGAVSKTLSSDTGNYTVPQLVIGDYDMTVALTGFKSYSRKGFHLAAGQVLREDITLEVGQTSESVTVTAEATLLKTETTELAQNVTLKQLNNLPILAVGSTNSGFRDPFAAVRLVPGVQYNNGSNIASGTTSAVNSMVINGTPANTVQTRLDGMTMNPTGPRLLGATMQTQPSVDAIEEVAVMTSNFAAEYGTAGGAMITMTTKSGTNAYHGSVYDYGTNEALNAHRPYSGLRDKIRQNDFGFSLGGPVKIPKLYDGTNKTFFFASWEMFKQKNIVNDSVSVPTAAYRMGDFSNLVPAENRIITRAVGTGANATTVPVYDPFGNTIPSGQIYDPGTQRAITCNTAPINGNVPTCTNGSTYQYRDPFPGNKIPLNRLDPTALKILGLVPNPQGVNFDKGLVTGNYTGTYDTSRTSTIPSIKIDQNIGSKGRLSIYYQRTETFSPRTPTGADPLPDLITAGVTTYSAGKTGRVSYDYTVSPRFLMHFGAGWNDSDFKLEAPVTNYDFYKEMGVPGQVEARYFPVIQTGENTTNNQIGGMTLLGNVYATKSFERRPSGTVSGTYIVGSHTFKFGADGRIEKFPNYVRSGVNANTTGNYTFGVNYTEQPYLLGTTTNQGFDGFQLASFLLAGVSSAAEVAPTALSNSKSQWAFYGQDTWKVTRKLTLDYGLRWDYGTYAREQYGRNGSIGLAIPNPSASGRPGATQFESTCNCNFAGNYGKAFGPRVGVAYQINPKTVFRAGFGIVYNATSTSSGSSTQSATSGAVPGNSGQIVSFFQGGLPAAGVAAVWPSTDPGVGQPVGQVVGMPALLDRNAGRPARLAQWSIGFQREFTRNTVVEASYVGNRGVWWSAAGLSTLNTLSEATLRGYGFNNFASATEAALLTTTVAGLSANQRGILAARGITGLPYANFPSSQTVRQSLFDYPQYNSNGLSGAPLGNTWYDAFQLNVTQRFSHGLSFNMNYTYSKNLSLMSSPDVFNRQLGKNLSGNDVPQQIRLTAQYVVPSMKNEGWGFLSNKYVAYALADWGLGAYLSYQSAPVLGRPTSTSTTPINQFLGRGPGPAQLKDGMNPYSVDWTDYDGVHHTDPLDINCHCYDPTKTQVLNPNAWTNIPDGQFGAQQTTIRSYRGIRAPVENANFSRNFRFGREGRFNFNARVEFNNIFNRMILPNPSAGVAFAPAPIKITDTSNPNVGLYSGGFGTYNVLGGIGNQRTGTFVGRFTF